jgi:hypothetical protein
MDARKLRDIHLHDRYRAHTSITPIITLPYCYNKRQVGWIDSAKIVFTYSCVLCTSLRIVHQRQALRSLSSHCLAAKDLAHVQLSIRADCCCHTHVRVSAIKNVVLLRRGGHHGGVHLLY